jgi:predicted phage-related endonuclease
MMPEATREAEKQIWLEKRRKVVTASDLGILFGEGYSGTSPSLLYAQKRGLAPEVQETEKMQWGILMEPVIAEMYHRVTGIPMRLTNAWDLTTHLQYPRHGATLDGWDAEGTLCEIKNTEMYVDKVVDLFMGWRIQCQWQMHVTGKESMRLVICQRGSKLVIHEQERDDEFIERACEKADEFLACLDEERSPAILEDGNDNAAMKYLYKAEPCTSIVIEDPDIEVVLAERAQALADQKALKARLQFLDATTKDYLREAETGILPDGGRVTWKEDKNGRRSLRHYKPRS